MLPEKNYYTIKLPINLTGHSHKKNMLITCSNTFAHLKCESCPVVLCYMVVHVCCLQELVTELHMQSIFTDVGKLSLQDPSHSAIIPNLVGHAGSPSTSTAWLSHQGEAHYALASPDGGIMVVTLPPHDTQGKASFYSRYKALSVV